MRSPVPGMAIAAHDVARAVEHDPEGVHDDEDRDLGRADLAERRALARGFAALDAEDAPAIGEAPGPARAQREPTRDRRERRGSAQRVIGMDRVVAPPVVVDDGAAAHRVFADGPAALCPQRREHPAGRLEAGQRPAREADRVAAFVVADGARAPAAHVDRRCHALREHEGCAAGRAFVVLRHADAQRREIEGKCRSVEGHARLHGSLVGMGMHLWQLPGSMGARTRIGDSAQPAARTEGWAPVRTRCTFARSAICKYTSEPFTTSCPEANRADTT